MKFQKWELFSGSPGIFFVMFLFCVTPVLKDNGKILGCSNLIVAILVLCFAEKMQNCFDYDLQSKVC